MAADPVLRPAAEAQGATFWGGFDWGDGALWQSSERSRPGDVMLVGSGPTVLDIYVRSSVETSLYGQRLDRVLYIPPPVGTATIVLENFTSTASGAETLTGTAAITLDNFASTASGTETFVGTASITLAAFTSTASGTGGTPAPGSTVYVGTVAVVAVYLGGALVTLE